MPFSTYGSYLVIGHLKGFITVPQLYMRSVHSQERGKVLFQVLLEQNGQEISWEESMTPSRLLLENEEKEARCDIVFEDENTLRFRAENCCIHLIQTELSDYQLAYPVKNGCFEFNTYSHKMHAAAVKGNLCMEAPWNRMKSDKVDLWLYPGEAGGELILEEYANVWMEREYKKTFEECAAERDAAFADFWKRTLPVPARYETLRYQAAYLNWSAVVRREGYLKRDTMYMSKNWMNNVWSWDHCFNAMALAKGNPQLSFDQFMAVFDFQDETGSLPDCVGDANIIRNFVKPPVHGIALQYMLENSETLTEERMRLMYEPLIRWTDWWFAYRDDDGDQIPQYHHGNDSGWDNSTVFGESPLIEGVDLSAFLVIQYEVLATLSDKLGYPERQMYFAGRSRELLAKMTAHFTTEQGLKSMETGSHRIGDGDSLLNSLPLVLGRRLPENTGRRIVDGLKEEGRFLTKHGFATESLRSKWYEDDGYWRGPIWAPSTWLLIYGLKAWGEKEFALSISEAYCQMCRKHGFAENFDAKTGEGLRDKAYTWTSSVFLLLANDIYEEELKRDEH